jgi:hypothetical protein
MCAVLTARCGCGQVCLVHIARGMKSLQDFRKPAIAVPTITHASGFLAIRAVCPNVGTQGNSRSTDLAGEPSIATKAMLAIPATSMAAAAAPANGVQSGGARTETLDGTAPGRQKCWLNDQTDRLQGAWETGKCSDGRVTSL